MDDSRRRGLKAFRVLCDGCERSSANLYCNKCEESACATCAEQLHVRGRRSSKKASPRTCKGKHMKDLTKTTGIIPLCKTCRIRPATKVTNGEVYPVCKECRQSYSSRETKPRTSNDVVKRALNDEMSRSKGSSSSSKNSNVKRRQKRGPASASENHTSTDDATNLGFGRRTSAD